MTRRLPIVVILVALVVGGVVADRSDTADEVVSTAAAIVDSSVFPIAADPSALSSTWFCAGGTADEEAFADHSVVVANPTPVPITVSLTAFGGVVLPPLATADADDSDDADETTTTLAPSDDEESAADETSSTTAAPTETPEPVVTSLEVPARSRQRVALRDLLEAPVASALVEAPSGGIVVEHEVTSVNGRDAKPCVTSAASTWHFAFGETTVDARELLVLFNPFPDDAVVDGRFSTEDGARQPERFDGLVVPARGTVAVDLGDAVTRREEVAATITARNGRLVVDRILRFDSDAERGLTVQSGTPEPQQTWVFPDGFLSETTREEYAVYNPGGELAEVEIEFLVDDPETNGIPERISLSIPPGVHQLVDVGADGRVPVDVGHTGIVRSANGVPIVAERVLYAERDNRRGVSVTTGSPVESERWNFAAGATTEADDEFVVLVNLDAQILAEVDVTAVVGGQEVPISGLQGIELAPGERRALSIDEAIDNRPDLSLVVTSTEPIVAERSLYRVGAEERGFSSAVGIPTTEGLRVPLDPLDAVTDVDLGDPDPDDPDPDDGVPVAPDDVELPAPDETIVIDDPDAPAEQSTTTVAPTTTGPATTAPPGDVPDTAP